MRKIETTEQEIIISKESRCTSVTCDICGQTGAPGFDADPPIDFDNYDWGGAAYHETIRTEISLTHSYDYHDSKHGYSKYFDICLNCMEKIVFPLIEKQIGIKHHKVDHDS